MRRGMSLLCVALAGTGLCFGCGENATLFNPGFINYSLGGIYPLVPGPQSGFILVRVINSTSNPSQNARFVVTAERQDETTDENGVTTITTEMETVRLQTYPEGRANEVGILFDCPVLRVGLGENIGFPGTEPGVYLGAVPGQAEGFGVPGHVNPLSAIDGNFECGDTLVFEATSWAGAAGNIKVVSYVLDADEQPAQISGPDTFNNARTVLEQYSFED
ncbi:MAG: hypothetical protein KAV82_15300 [Phycisphaerae bacterium]|nr:hypothetical protein [Phycisphaerae bacterium]